MSGYRVLLSLHVQATIRQSVKTQYWLRRSGTNFVATIKLHKAYWTGDACQTENAAKEDAAKKAYYSLSTMGEPEIRASLGLPAREAVPEIDDIRDALRALKRRLKNEYSSGVAKMKINKLVKLYYEIESVERQILA